MCSYAGGTVPPQLGRHSSFQATGRNLVPCWYENETQEIVWPILFESIWNVQFTKSSDVNRQHRHSSQSHDSKRSGLGIARLDTCLLQIKDQHSNGWGNQSHIIRGFEPRGRWYAHVAKHIAAGGFLSNVLKLWTSLRGWFQLLFPSSG